MTDTLVVVNPVSGGGRGRALAEEAVRRLQTADRGARLVETRGGGDARGAAAEFVDDGGLRVVACGGDGTVHEVVGALAGTRATLGLVPCGRGNDFARTLGIPRDPRRAIDLLVDGVARRIDIGRVGETPFATVASAGIDAEVGRRVLAGRRWLSGRQAYVFAFLRAVWSYRCPEVRIEGDFGTFEGRALLVAAGNTCSYGGGMTILPDADCTDGLLDVCLVPEAPRATVLRTFPRIFRGTHVSHPLVRIERTRSLRIEAAEPLAVFADGEPAGEAPVTVSAQAGALSVVVPRRQGRG